MGAEIVKIRAGPEIFHHGVVGDIVALLRVQHIIAGAAVEIVVEVQIGATARTMGAVRTMGAMRAPA